MAEEKPKKSKWYLWACGCVIILIILVVGGFFIYKSLVTNSNSGTSQKDKPMTNAELINYFVEETTTNNGINTVVEKWEKPTVTVSIADTPPDGADKAIGDFVTAFNKNSTKVQLKQVSTGGDIKVYFQKNASGNVGESIPVAGADHVIYNGEVRMSEESALFQTSLSAVFAHEMMHALGFTGHYSDSVCRLMDPKACGNHMTINEERLIQMLYSTDLPAGSNADEVRTYFQNWTPK
jgi:hypothetical protein